LALSTGGIADELTVGSNRLLIGADRDPLANTMDPLKIPCLEAKGR